MKGHNGMNSQWLTDWEEPENTTLSLIHKHTIIDNASENTCIKLFSLVRIKNNRSNELHCRKVGNLFFKNGSELTVRSRMQNNKCVCVHSCLCVCKFVLACECVYHTRTNEVCGASTQVLSSDGDLGPWSALVGWDARHQGGLVGTRHGGGHVCAGTQSQSVTCEHGRGEGKTEGHVTRILV